MTAARVLVPCFACFACVAGCSSHAKLQGPGGACFQVTDCELGLVCVPQPGSSADGPHECSGDTSALVHTEGNGMPDSALDAAPDVLDELSFDEADASADAGVVAQDADGPAE